MILKHVVKGLNVDVFICICSSETKEIKRCIECCNLNCNFWLYIKILLAFLYISFFKYGLLYIRNKAYSGTRDLLTEGKSIKFLYQKNSCH